MKENTNSKSAEATASDNTHNENICSFEQIASIINNVTQGNSISDVEIVDNNIMLLTIQENDTTKIVFLNLCTTEIVQTYNLENSKAPFDCYIYQDYIVLYDSGNCIFIFNANYELIYSIDISSLKNVYEHGIKNYCIFPQKNKLFYIKDECGDNDVFQALYECSYNGDNTQKILQLDGPKTNINYVNTFNQILLSADLSSIYFTGDYFRGSDSGEMSLKCYGSYSLKDGTIYVQHEKYTNIILISEGAAFSESLLSSEENPSGVIKVFKGSEPVGNIKCKCKQESEQISSSLFSSNIYTYYASNKNCNNEITETVVSKYNLKSSKYMGKISIPYNLTNVTIFEDNNFGVGLIYRQGKTNRTLYFFSLDQFK